MEALAVSGEVVGEPGERVVGMAEHVGAGAAADLTVVDDGAAGDLQEIRRLGARHGLAEHAAGGEEIIRHQCRRAHGFPFDVAVVDQLDRGIIRLDAFGHPLGGERLFRW